MQGEDKYHLYCAKENWLKKDLTVRQSRRGRSVNIQMNKGSLPLFDCLLVTL